ncbi:MAG: transcription termination factor NusA [Candidatus Aminicenantes bacterium]|nr:transcription termination factor NusA [Candidatus Aminicenantes bacterium]TFG58407.1 MAG: transcription termination factor NusA [Candidatus Aminicenantes bacterium]
MKVNVWNTIMQLSKERSVEPRLIIQAIEESLRVASSQFFSQKENVQILFKPEKGELRVFVVKQVTERPKNTALEISLDEARALRPEAQVGEAVEIDLPSDTLGRIAAQAAKKVIFQKVRDAEQDKIYGDFAPRIGEIVTGVVRRIEDNVIILEVNRIEVSFPLRETLPNEEHRRGDLVKAVIIQVLKGYQGPQIIVSRANPRFLGRLLETEIPEIANGAIEIKDIVRQPGERAKVAVTSHERDVDPIGACIGVKGNRILAISKELQGEKVDIIEWSSDLVSYAKSALSPAKVARLQVMSQAEKALLAIVPQDQLSLAIGKKGINVKLASRLVGWKISIKQEDANE